MRLLLATALGALLAAPLLLASPASAEETCNIHGPMMGRKAITASLHSRGYAQIRGLSTHNGCYEVKGLDGKGKRFELELNGATGAVMRKE